MKTNNGSLKKASKMDRNQAIRNTEGAIACKNFLSMANLMAKNCIMISKKGVCTTKNRGY
jgi:hypothetical protein